MVEALYIFVTSERPDQYLNPILHCLQSRNLSKIVFVHVEGVPDSEDDPNISARSVRENVESLLTLLAYHGKYKYFVKGMNEGKEVDLQPFYISVKLASMKE